MVAFRSGPSVGEVLAANGLSLVLGLPFVGLAGVLAVWSLEEGVGLLMGALLCALVALVLYGRVVTRIAGRARVHLAPDGTIVRQEGSLRRRRTVIGHTRGATGVTLERSASRSDGFRPLTDSERQTDPVSNVVRTSDVQYRYRVRLDADSPTWLLTDVGRRRAEEVAALVGRHLSVPVEHGFTG